MDASPLLVAQSRRIQVLTGSRSAPSGAPVVQRYGQIRFANVNEDSDKYRSKAEDLIAVLQGSDVLQQYLEDKNALILLEFNGSQLATVREEGDQVQIRLSPWFFEQQSRGRIIGMLAHEFGVHPVARARMTQEEQEAEHERSNARTPVPTGVREDAIHYDGSNQRDHIYAAVQGEPRFVAYRDTVVSLIRSMLGRGGTVTEAHITDAIMSYLADIAMILATNDHRGRTVVEATRAAEYFNVVRTSWLEYLGTVAQGEDIARLTPAEQGAGGVLAEVGAVAGRFALSLFTWSKSDAKQQTEVPTLGFNAVTANQREVMEDHGWELLGADEGGERRNFLRAIAPALDLEPGEVTDHLRERLEHFIQQANDDGRDFWMGLRGFESRLRAQVTRDDLYATAWVMQRRLRVMDARGVIDSVGPERGEPILLVFVPTPNPHYLRARAL